MDSIAHKYMIVHAGDVRRMQQSYIRETMTLLGDYSRAAASYRAGGDDLMAAMCQHRADVLHELLERFRSSVGGVWGVV